MICLPNEVPFHTSTENLLLSKVKYFYIIRPQANELAGNMFLIKETAAEGQKLSALGEPICSPGGECAWGAAETLPETTLLWLSRAKRRHTPQLESLKFLKEGILKADQAFPKYFWQLSNCQYPEKVAGLMGLKAHFHWSISNASLLLGHKKGQHSSISRNVCIASIMSVSDVPPFPIQRKLYTGVLVPPLWHVNGTAKSRKKGNGSGFQNYNFRCTLKIKNYIILFYI